jgi:L-alanine-DL-glutamate epimerase-like enolase superfamily enzyme
MKIRVWRPNPLDDAEVCKQIKAAVGPDFALMFDRTAHAPQDAGQKIWDYETGLKVARALEQNGAYWLEEPFARDDYLSPAKLAREVDIPILLSHFLVDKVRVTKSKK